MKCIMNRKGSSTVEAALIVPLMMLIIMAIFYLSIVHYQNGVSMASGMQSSNRIAVAWSYIGNDDEAMLNSERGAEELIQMEYFKNRDPYRFIIDTKQGVRKNRSEAYALAMAKAGKLNQYADETSESDVIVNRDRGFLTDYVEVESKKRYTNPLGNAFAGFGVGAAQENKSLSKAPIHNEPEFIRNVDLIMELANDFGLLQN